MSRYVKGIVTNIPVVQIERAIVLVNEAVEADVRERFERDFGVNITAIDINTIEVDKTSEGYQQLKAVTQELCSLFWNSVPPSVHKHNPPNVGIEKVY